MLYCCWQSIAAEAATEMEKRRQKIQVQQMKRREEQEQKRVALEAEMSRKREAQKYVNSVINSFSTYHSPSEGLFR